MRLLLDTHVFLWYITGDERLPHGRWWLCQPPAAKHQPLLRHGIASLSLNEAAVTRLVDLPTHHRDPFDRILVCQSIEHDLHIVTVDPAIVSYPAKLLAPD